MWRDKDPDGRAWLDAGFTAREAELWRKWRIPLKAAQEWRACGVADGLRAAQWSVAGVTPDTVGQWRAAGIDAAEAVHCHEMGYDLRAARELKRRGLTAEEAYEQGLRGSGPHGIGGPLRPPTHPAEHAYVKFQKAGVQPQVIAEYMMANWTDDEALRWAVHQIPATDARMWRDLKVKPVEAGRLARKGRSPMDIVSEWWRAGIPFDEVADWLGAGLTAAEAASQRARGITVEQAAALRALRNSDDGIDDPSG